MFYFFRPFFSCTNCEDRRYVALLNFRLLNFLRAEYSLGAEQLLHPPPVLLPSNEKSSLMPI